MDVSIEFWDTVAALCGQGHGRSRQRDSDGFRHACYHEDVQSYHHKDAHSSYHHEDAQSSYHHEDVRSLPQVQSLSVKLNIAEHGRRFPLRMSASSLPHSLASKVYALASCDLATCGGLPEGVSLVQASASTSGGASTSSACASLWSSDEGSSSSVVLEYENSSALFFGTLELCERIAVHDLATKLRACIDVIQSAIHAQEVDNELAASLASFSVSKGAGEHHVLLTRDAEMAENGEEEE